jgi:DeoR/GlpR family transcriptional regulator of sugar metabolism
VIASVLQYCGGIEVLLLGGYLRRGSPDLIGALTEQNLENLRADFAFIGADGIDLAGNIYNDSLEVARMLGKMAATSSVVYVVADRSKIGKTALARFGNVGQWQALITDKAAPSGRLGALRMAGSGSFWPMANRSRNRRRKEALEA